MPGNTSSFEAKVDDLAQHGLLTVKQPQLRSLLVPVSWNSRFLPEAEGLNS